MKIKILNNHCVDGKNFITIDTSLTKELTVANNSARGITGDFLRCEVTENKRPPDLEHLYIELKKVRPDLAEKLSGAPTKGLAGVLKEIVSQLGSTSAIGSFVVQILDNL